MQNLHILWAFDSGRAQVSLGLWPEQEQSHRSSRPGVQAPRPYRDFCRLLFPQHNIVQSNLVHVLTSVCHSDLPRPVWSPKCRLKLFIWDQPPQPQAWSAAPWWTRMATIFCVWMVLPSERDLSSCLAHLTSLIGEEALSINLGKYAHQH